MMCCMLGSFKVWSQGSCPKSPSSALIPPKVRPSQNVDPIFFPHTATHPDPKKVGYLGKLLTDMATHPFVKEDAYIVIRTTVGHLAELTARLTEASIHLKQVTGSSTCLTCSCLTMVVYADPSVHHCRVGR